MNITPSEAEQALAAIQNMAQRTRRSIASSGAYISLIVTGATWLTGFVCTQFLTGPILLYLWIGLSVIGSSLASVLGRRASAHIHNPLAGATARQIMLAWLALLACCLALLVIAWPLEARQLTALIILFVLTGWMVTGQMLSFTSILPGLSLIALVLGCYFFLPGFFYFGMGILVGGGMIVFGIIIRARW